MTALRPVAVPVAVVLVLVAGVGGIGTASAAAIPGTPLYPTKLAIEQAQLLVAYTPELQTGTHLKIAESRLQEADAVSQQGNQTEAQALVQSSEQQVGAAQAAVAQVHSSAYREQVNQTLANLKARQKEISAPVTTVDEQAGSNGSNDHENKNGSTPPGLANAHGQAAGKHDHSGKDHPGKPASAEALSPGSDVQAAKGNRNAAGGNDNQPATPPEADPSEQLVHALIAQALAGDVAGANKTSAAYVAAVQAEKSANPNAVNQLNGQRKQLQHALAQAEQARLPTVSIIQAALNAIDGTKSGSSGPPSSQGHPNDNPGNANHGNSGSNNGTSDDGDHGNSKPGNQGHHQGSGNSSSLPNHGANH